MKQRTHTNAYDYLRVLAAFGVVLMHTAAPALRGEINGSWHVVNVLTCISFMAVPLFFMMSGDLLLNTSRTADISYLLKKRLPRLLIPMCLWTLVYALWYSRGEMSLGAVGQQLFLALREPIAPHLHFMYTLLAIYVISPFLYSAVKGLNQTGRRYAAVLLLLVSAKAMVVSSFPGFLGTLASVDIITALEFLGGNLCTFLLGYFLATTKKKPPVWLLTLLWAAMLAVVILGTWLRTVKNGAYAQDFLNQRTGFEVLMAGCIFLIFRQKLSAPRPKLQRFLSPVVTLAYPIYLLHILVLDLCYAVGIYPMTYWGVALLSLGVFLACFLATVTLTTIKPLCYIFTGIPYEEACSRCNWIALFRRN